MKNQENLIRQWTVRVASDQAQFCFVSSFSGLAMPEIKRDDIFEGHEMTMPIIAAPLKLQRVEFEIPSLENLDFHVDFDTEPWWKTSQFIDEFDDSFQMTVKHSDSAYLSMSEWGMLDDEKKLFGLSL
jgi:hypothetical protein